MPHSEYFAASLKKHDTREGFSHSYSINTLVSGAIKNLLRPECLEQRDGTKQANKLQRQILSRIQKTAVFSGSTDLRHNVQRALVGLGKVFP